LIIVCLVFTFCTACSVVLQGLQCISENASPTCIITVSSQFDVDLVCMHWKMSECTSTLNNHGRY
jgi:hypothetical protein